MNAAPTPITTSTVSSSNAGGQSNGAQPADAFALLFGSVQGAPLLTPSAPLGDLAPTEDTPAIGADLSGWLQQLPLSPLLGPMTPEANASGGQATALPQVAAPAGFTPGSSLASTDTWNLGELPPNTVTSRALPLDGAQLLAGKGASPLPNSDAALPSGVSLPAVLAAAQNSLSGASLGKTYGAVSAAGDGAPAAPISGKQISSALFSLADAPQQGANEILPAPLRSGEAVAAAMLQRTEIRGGTLDNVAANSAAANPPAPALAAALPPGSAPRIDQAFAEGMALRMQWMTLQKVGRVEIQLHPEDLGSIDVQIEFEGKSIRADFQSPIAEVRHLLESSLPRLRELLETHGLQLRHADVGSGQGHGHHGTHRHEDSAPRMTPSQQGGGEEARNEIGSTPPKGHQHGGQLSEYA